jgi:TRAP-type mannitol/chloroaromatic compound transport system permease small subunit
LSELLSRLLSLIDQCAELTGKVIAPLLALMLLATFTVVISRYGFDYGAAKLQESVVYLHATVFMLGFGYTLKQGGHVRVDIFYQRLSRRRQSIVNLIGTLVFLMPMSGFILYASLDYVSFSWQLKEGSPDPGGLPFVYLLKTLIPLSATLLLLQGLGELIRNSEQLGPTQSG